MITVILSMSVVWCLFYGKIYSPVLALLCAGLGTGLAVAGRHGHSQLLTIDVVAQTSRLKKINPALKFWTALILMAVCISSRSPAGGYF